MNKQEIINSLRLILEAANAADVAQGEEDANDLPRECAASWGLFGHVQAALVELGQGPNIEAWSERGDWNDVNPFAVGDVVRYADRRRRYVVTHVDGSRVNLAALSGGFAGSAPGTVDPRYLCLDDDQTVEFSGARANKLRASAWSSVHEMGLIYGGMDADQVNAITRAWK